MLTPTDQATEQDELTAERRRKDREKAVKYRRARKAAADRFAELEKLNERGQLTSEQAGELAALQPKAAEWKQQKKAKKRGRGRKKKDREVMETGVGEVPVAGRDERIAGPAGVSELTGTDQDGWHAVAGSAVSGDLR
ncbi:hypothetical protein [Saccharopolyspora spinosa]|uniref:hypothetical protein n=1 Tax=Saccharopolyspora spinosa TaxID=60894 RepID=UPI0002378A3F|nr:hypothetical protein [Saccharopolyspora spinosa]